MAKLHQQGGTAGGGFGTNSGGYSSGGRGPKIEEVD